MSKTQAIKVADSLSPQDSRLTTILATFPRFILAELNTHRMLSKNSASSRAIPFEKMVKSVEENPFIPIAWQKDHKGMQGTEYLTDDDDIKDAESNWLRALDYALMTARDVHRRGVTKQLCNRLLEPFMWHKVLITATEWENFFELRCPQYVWGYVTGEPLVLNKNVFRSRKDAEKVFPNLKDKTDLEWLQINTGQAEIHMMALAEAIWDAMNESKPKQLKAGEWHIPFEDKINEQFRFIPVEYAIPSIVKISTAMAARTSYTVVGDENEISYERLIGIHDRMAEAKPFHASPFEHCARAMSNAEYWYYTKQQGKGTADLDANLGWCRNFKGFIQYREILENKYNGK